MIWFTSDTHFGHENMLRLADRPWSTGAQMNDAMVANVNSKVALDDELYILGDFSFKMTVQDAYELRKSIACKHVHLLLATTTKTGRSLRWRMLLSSSRPFVCSGSTAKKSC